MMYSNKLAVAVKSNGKVLREQGETVFLPFGQEFTILIKNLNSLRCLVKVHIDGTDATDGTQLIINGNSELELKRYIKNGNLNSGNSFKFIERTASIENGPRGTKIDDGLVRIEFEFEREPTPIKQPQIWSDPYHGYPRDKYFLGGYQNVNAIGSMLDDSRGLLRSRGVSASISGNVEPQAMYNATATSANLPEIKCSAAINDVGITVPGSVSDQKFTVGAWFPTDGVKHVMVMKLLGETTQGKQVVEAVTVKAKPTCVTCGRVNKATSKFCTNCGTSLTLI